MRSQVGPASKELVSIEVAETFLGAPEVSVVLFGTEDSKLKGKSYTGIFVKFCPHIRLLLLVPVMLHLQTNLKLLVHVS